MPGWKSNSQGPRSRGVPKAVADQVMARDHYECQAQLHGCTVIANEVDHVVPVFEGGNDELENLRAICSSCHKKKSPPGKRPEPRSDAASLYGPSPTQACCEGGGPRF